MLRGDGDVAGLPGVREDDEATNDLHPCDIAAIDGVVRIILRAGRDFVCADLRNSRTRFFRAVAEEWLALVSCHCCCGCQTS